MQMRCLQVLDPQQGDCTKWLIVNGALTQYSKSQFSGRLHNLLIVYVALSRTAITN
jgi:hypothetical protein